MEFFKIFQKDPTITSAKLSNDINDNIRLIAYQNSCSILFDTLQIDAIKQNGKVNSTTPSSPSTPQSNGTHKQSPAKPKGKVEMLKEMMFGTVPLNVQGTTTKIHYLQDSNQMLLTKLFTLNLTRDEPTSNPQSPNIGAPQQSSNQTQSQQQQQNKQDNLVNSNKELPTYSNEDHKSLPPSSPSKTTDHIPSTKPSLNSSTDSSSQTPTTPSSTTDNKSNTLKLNGSTGSSSSGSGTPGNRIRSSSTLGRTTRPMMMTSVAPKVKKVTLALCVIFGPKNFDDPPVNHNNDAQMQQISKFHQFVITHFVLINMRLQPMIKLLKNQFYSKFTQISHGSMSAYGLSEVNQIYKEVEKFRSYINDLYYVPRLEKPIWIDTLVFPSTKRQTYKILLDSLRELLPSFNTPKTRFFLSNLITSVLSYNLTWMSNILSTDSSTSYRCTSEKCNSFISFENQFLNQISEIYGYTGCLNPGCHNTKSHYRMVRAIVVGAPEISKKILQIISYFWRSFELILNRQMLDYRSHLYDSDELRRSFIIPEGSSNSSMGNLATSPPQNRTDYNPHQYPMTPNNQTRLPPINGRNVNSSSSFTSQPTPNKQSTLNNNSKPSPSSTPSKSSNIENFQFGSDDPSLPSQYHDLSRSLLGSHSTKYVSDMALMALPKYDFFTKMIDDLRLWNDNYPFQSHLKESICIVADISKSSCDVIVVSKDLVMRDTNPIVVNGTSYPDVSILKGVHSEYITNTLTTLVSFWQLGMHPETCIVYLEDKLRELFLKSITYYETIRQYSIAGKPIPSTINQLSTGTPTPSSSTFTTPLATPSTSPHSSVPSYSALRRQMTGDQILIEGIYTYLMNCYYKPSSNTGSSNQDKSSMSD